MSRAAEAGDFQHMAEVYETADGMSLGEREALLPQFPHCRSTRPDG